jgi:hypothetical protein
MTLWVRTRISMEKRSFGTDEKRNAASESALRTSIVRCALRRRTSTSGRKREVASCAPEKAMRFPRTPRFQDGCPACRFSKEESDSKEVFIQLHRSRSTTLSPCFNRTTAQSYGLIDPELHSSRVLPNVIRAGARPVDRCAMHGAPEQGRRSRPPRRG